MNITNIAKKWLIEHDHYEHEPSFEDDLNSLCKLIEGALEYSDEGGIVGYAPDYDEKFGDNKLCECGHPYYRHFDTYANMDPVGCKYCHWKECAGYKEATK